MVIVKPVQRRSHTKSISGCQACKRRHVKCDEFRPGCRRCLALGLACIYPVQDVGKCGETISLWWPPCIQQSCTKWKESGQPPFPVLSLTVSPSWHNMPMTDLRYLYQMALVATTLELSGTSDMCLSWGEFPILFRLATNFDYVSYALVAMSAQRLALLTKSHTAFHDACQYRDRALRGLGRAMQSFSRHNADAILGASLACSYQMPNYRSLMSIMRSISTVTYQMRPWSKESEFHHLFALETFHQQYEAVTISPEGPSVGNEFVDRIASAGKLLVQGVDSLNGLAHCLRNDSNLAAMARQLRDVMRLVQERLGTNISVTDQYRFIHPFASWFTKNSTTSYVALSEREPLLLIFLLHMYAVVLSLVVALPAVDAPHFASIRLRGMHDIRSSLEKELGFSCMACNAFHSYSHLMVFPLNAIYTYQSL